jgi:two-component system, NtrC family, nitrogen regulation response regulator GlnG
VVATADRDLESEVESGRFMDPLLGRLAGFRLHIPPLRERPEDTAAILADLLREELEAHGKEDLLATGEEGDPLWLSARLASRLLRHRWPGNVRQLRNVTRQVVIESLDAPESCDELLNALLGGGSAEQGPGENDATGSEVRAVSGRKAAEIDDDEIRRCERRHGGDVKRMAKALEVSVRALKRRMKELSRR